MKKRNPTEEATVAVLHGTDGLTVNQIAAALNTTKDSVAKNVYRYAQKGLVLRIGPRGYATQIIRLAAGYTPPMPVFESRDWFAGWAGAPKLGLR